MMVIIFMVFSLTFRKYLMLWMITWFLKKLQHYRIREVSDKWFVSYLTSGNQFMSINGFNSALDVNICEMPQGSYQIMNWFQFI